MVYLQLMSGQVSFSPNVSSNRSQNNGSIISVHGEAGALVYEFSDVRIGGEL